MNNFQMVKFTDKDFELDVRADSENETVWLSNEEISSLFGRDQTVISRNIKNVFFDKEVEEKSNVHFLHITNLFKEGEFQRGTSVQKMHKSPDAGHPNYRRNRYYC